MKIYLISCNLNDTVTYKIGKTSRNAKARLAELSTGNAGQLRVVCEYECHCDVNLLEISLHNYYKNIKLSGEWFSDELDSSEFISVCKSIDNNLKILKDNGNPFI